MRCSTATGWCGDTALCGRCRLAAKDPAYRAAFDAHDGTAAPKSLPVIEDCGHRSAAPIGEVQCPTCAGSVRLKVYGCAVYGRCTLGKAADGHALCSGCAARDQPTPPPPIPPFEPRPGDPAVGVSIGCYLWPELIPLQCRLIRATCGPVSVLISWDHDPAHFDRTAEAERLAAAEGADFLTHAEKLGHTAGDAAAYWQGIEWAAEKGLAVVAKLSQRMLLTQPRWLQDGAADLILSGLALSSRRCVGKWQFPLRTESVLMNVARWNKPAVLSELQRWRFHDRGGPAGYSFEHRLPELVAAELGGVYWPWELIGDRREVRMPGVIWHDSHDRREYARLAARFGVTLPPDFTTEGWGWQLKNGGYSYG